MLFFVLLHLSNVMIGLQSEMFLPKNLINYSKILYCTGINYEQELILKTSTTGTQKTKSRLTKIIPS